MILFENGQVYDQAKGRPYRWDDHLWRVSRGLPPVSRKRPGGGRYRQYAGRSHIVKKQRLISIILSEYFQSTSVDKREWGDDANGRVEIPLFFQRMVSVGDALCQSNVTILHETDST
jgi:hypothetical protein